MKFEVKLTLTIEAESQSAAYDIGVEAAEHLNDTFNDNGSLAPFMLIQVSEGNSHGHH
jgi:hypothetical protein